MEFRPSLFLLTGVVWLLLASLLGLALFLGVVVGHPLPPVLRQVHIHGALVGGISQIILGGLLTVLSPLLTPGQGRADAHPLLYVLLNAGTIGMLAGFGVGEMQLVGISGAFILLAFMAVASDAIGQAGRSLVPRPWSTSLYGAALLALFAGLGAGLAVSFHLFPSARAELRLGHVYLTLLAFVTLVIVAATHDLLPRVLSGSLYSRRLAKATFVLMPIGIGMLIAGFLLVRGWVEIGAGALILIATLLYAGNMAQTWRRTGHLSNPTAHHFIMATLFLLLAVACGILVAIDHLRDPPAVPFGRLHLLAYSHLALVGFMLQTVLGALSHLLPVMLALRRVKSNKKRLPYLAHVTAVMERWQPIQVGAISLGTLGLVAVAALVWTYALAAVPVQIAAWTSAALLFLGLALFGTKVVLALGLRPEGKE